MSKKITMRTDSSKAYLREFIRWIRKQGYSTTKMILAEIGAFAGDGTEIFSANFAKVYTVDPWESGIGGINDSCDMQEIYKEYKERTEELWNVETIIDFSKNAVKKFSGRKKELDIVYIDALHTYEAVKEDIKLWLPKVKKNGFIAGHDYWNKFPGVIEAVNEMVGAPDYVSKDSSWIKKISNIKTIKVKEEPKIKDIGKF